MTSPQIFERMPAFFEAYGVKAEIDKMDEGSMPRAIIRLPLFAVLVVLSLCSPLGFGGCSKEAPPPKRSTPQVTAVTIAQHTIPYTWTFVAQTESSRQVDIVARVRTAEAAHREAVSFYQQTIFNAFRETNNALVGTLKKRQEAEAQARRVGALREYARLSRLRFDNGAASYVEVLYAENELFGARLAAIQSKAQQYTELINVFNAMGGGWVTEAERLAPPPVMEDTAPARVRPH